VTAPQERAKPVKVMQRRSALYNNGRVMTCGTLLTYPRVWSLLLGEDNHQRRGFSEMRCYGRRPLTTEGRARPPTSRTTIYQNSQLSSNCSEMVRRVSPLSSCPVCDPSFITPGFGGFSGCCFSSPHLAVF
jgi:hypothetical protein